MRRDSLDLTMVEVVFIALLVGAFEFFFSFWMLRTEATSEPNVFISYWGFPFEAIKIKNIVVGGTWVDVGEIVSVRQTYEYLWQGIILNAVIYLLFSIIVVKLASWIRDEIKYRRYHKL